MDFNESDLFVSKKNKQQTVLFVIQQMSNDIDWCIYVNKYLVTGWTRK